MQQQQQEQEEEESTAVAAKDGTQHPQPVEMTFKSTFKQSYVRTRHNNMRCFPQCSKPHKGTSFCGRFVDVLVVNANCSSDEAKRAIFFGEFHKTSDYASFRVGDFVQRGMLKELSDKIMLGEFVSDTSDGGFHYMFDPKKRWTCLGRIQDGEEFVMTAYLAINGVVQVLAHSPVFEIIPVWKTEDRKRARTMAPSSSSGLLIAAAAAAAATSGDEDDEDGEENDGDGEEEEEEESRNIVGLAGEDEDGTGRAALTAVRGKHTAKASPPTPPPVSAFMSFAPHQPPSPLRQAPPSLAAPGPHNLFAMPLRSQLPSTASTITGGGGIGAQFSMFKPLVFPTTSAASAASLGSQQYANFPPILYPPLQQQALGVQVPPASLSPPPLPLRFPHFPSPPPQLPQQQQQPFPQHYPSFNPAEGLRSTGDGGGNGAGANMLATSLLLQRQQLQRMQQQQQQGSSFPQLFFPPSSSQQPDGAPPKQ